MTRQHPIRCASACYRSPFLGLAVLDGQRVVTTRTHRIGPGTAGHDRILHATAAVVLEFGPEVLAVEARTAQRLRIAPTCLIRTISLRDAKRRVAALTEMTHLELYQLLLERDPALRALAATIAANRPSLFRPWQTVRLLAIAVALAAGRRAHDDNLYI